MSSCFDDLCSSAPGDGAFAAEGVSPLRANCHHQEILEAWFLERQQSIELRLYLDQARRLLARILNEGEVSVESRRRTRLLLLAIRAAERSQRRRPS